MSGEGNKGAQIDAYGRGENSRKPVPHSVARDAASYETKDARVFVGYTNGGCDESRGQIWNVPDLTVFEISVEPKARPRLADLKLDMSEYRRTPDPEIIHLVEYVNHEDGITIVVDKDSDIVEGIRYYPKENDNVLKCKGRPGKTDIDRGSVVFLGEPRKKKLTERSRPGIRGISVRRIHSTSGT